MSEQSTEQNPAETTSTAVNVTGDSPDVEVHQHSGTDDAAASTDDSSTGDDASGSGDASSDGSAEDGGSAE